MVITVSCTFLQVVCCSAERQTTCKDKLKENTMQLVNFRLLVGDVPASIRFWRDIVQLPMQYGDEAMGYAYFETSSAGIELMQRDAFAAAIGTAAAAAPMGHLAAIVFKVDDVDASYASLVERGATPVAGPQDRA